MNSRYRYRRRSGYRSNYSRRNTYSRNRTSIVKRARGNARAANAQADTTDVIINLMHSTITTVTPCSTILPGANITINDVRKNTLSLGVTAINMYDLLAKSDFFNCYAPMYDQFRITSIKVKITPVKWSTYDQQISINNAKLLGVDTDVNNPPTAEVETDGNLTDAVINVPGSDYQYPQSLTIVTAWDRTGLSENQFNSLLELVKKNRNINTTLSENLKNSIYLSVIADADMTAKDTGIPKDIGRDNLFNSFFTNIGDAITTYSSAQTKQLISGQAFNCVRYLYPQNQQEKSAFYSTDNLNRVYEKGPNSTYYTSNINLPEGDLPVAFDGRDHLCSLTETPAIPFKPTLLIGVLGDSELTAYSQTNTDLAVNFVRYGNKIKPIKFNCEFDIGVTFRGLRKTQVV